MHVVDGMLGATTSLATGAASIATVGVALRRVGHELSEAAAPLAGLVAAFVFAVQMINFPVGVGTSGHLLGGALAAVLVGPWTAIVCLTSVLVVQALVFADGGLTALGTNVLLMGVVTVAVGWAVARGTTLLLPRRPSSAVPAAAAGALVSVPAASLAFVGLYAVAGTTQLPLARLAQYMIGWHVVIGVGESIITALTVAAIVATRPDLVHLARSVRRTLLVVAADGTTREEVVGAAGTAVAGDAASTRASRGPGPRTAGTALAVSLLLAGVVAASAGRRPDVLDGVAARVGLHPTAQEPLTAGSPLGDYAVAGVTNPWVATGIAGVLGVVGVLGISLLVSWAVAARSRRAVTTGG